MHTITLRHLLWLFLVGQLVSSCVPNRAAINNGAQKAPAYWLTTSMYAGPFYDDDKQSLMDYRPFFAIDDAETADGYKITPPPHKELIEAGTLLRILRISYPDFKTKLNRPLYSPRQQVWVYFEVAKERGNVTIFHHQPYIMVLPAQVVSEADVDEYLQNFISNKDPNSWLLTERNHLQKAIWQKRATLGMTEKHLRAALGPPLSRHVKKKTFTDHAAELWQYPDLLVVMEDGEVVKVSDLTQAAK